MNAPLTSRVAMQMLPASYLPPETPDDVRDVIARARLDLVEVVETPPASNRSPTIDDYNRRAGVPVGSYWCASALGAWYEDAGLPTPPGRAAVASWASWAKATGRWSATPVLGGAVLYAVNGSPHHIGLIARIDRDAHGAPALILSIEGNASLGTAFSNNGIAVVLRYVDPRDPRIVGYTTPHPRPAAVPAQAA